KFRALKAWVIWRSLGRAGIVARLREQIRLANLFAELVKQDHRFEISSPVSMGVVCFRFVGRDTALRRPVGAARRPDQKQNHPLDRINSDVVERINASGRAYLTQTKLRGQTVMRIGLGNILTTEEHLRKAWEIIRQTAPP